MAAGKKDRFEFIENAPEVELRDGLFHVSGVAADGTLIRRVFTVRAFFATYTAMGAAIREFERGANVTSMGLDEE